MIRYDAPAPVDFSRAQLRVLGRTVHPRVIDVNTIEGSPRLVSLYVDDRDAAPAVGTAWTAAVASYVISHPTPEEIEQTAAGNRSAIETNLLQDMTAMQAIIDTANISVANIAQAQTELRNLQRQLKDAARLNRRLIRYVLNQLEGTT